MPKQGSPQVHFAYRSSTRVMRDICFHNITKKLLHIRKKDTHANIRKRDNFVYPV